jgi:hypothetical protein
MASRSKVLSNGAVCGEKALRMAGRLEPPHAPFPLPRRWVGVLRPGVQRAVLPTFDPSSPVDR